MCARLPILPRSGHQDHPTNGSGVGRGTPLPLINRSNKINLNFIFYNLVLVLFFAPFILFRLFLTRLVPYMCNFLFYYKKIKIIIKDTLGAEILSSFRRLSSGGRFIQTTIYSHIISRNYRWYVHVLSVWTFKKLRNLLKSKIII